MTRTVARLVLAMLLLPASGAVFIILFVAMLQPGSPPSVFRLILLWSIVYLFIAVYWLLLWRSEVRWTPRRVVATAGGTAVALLSGVGMAALCIAVNNILPPQVLVLAGGGAVPIAWVLLTVIVWRETADERAQRLAAAGASDVICPVCGYRMTGLREARCPECGAAYTLEQLMAVQPGRAAATAL